MKAHQAQFRVQVMSRAFVVSRSAYYAWVKAGCRTQQERTDAERSEYIRGIFEQSGQTYGSPRVYAEMKAQGIRCSRRHVARLMREAGLNARPARRRVITTERDGEARSVSNLLDRDFTAEAPNRK